MDGEDKGEKRGLHHNCMSGVELHKECFRILLPCCEGLPEVLAPGNQLFLFDRTVGASNGTELVADPGCRRAQMLVEADDSLMGCS